MRGKFLFILGLAIGYVLGTRAGRRRYVQIKAAAQNIWDSEPIQWSVHQAQGAVGEVADDVFTAAKRVIHQVTGDKPAAKSGTKAAAKSGARTGVKAPATRRPAASKTAPARTVAQPTAEPAARKAPAKPPTES